MNEIEIIFIVIAIIILLCIFVPGFYFLVFLYFLFAMVAY